jgi:guanylate kinase
VYVDRDAFEAKLAEGGFLEHNEFLGNYYGTPIPDPGAGQDIVLEIDVNGAQQVRRLYPEALLIFLVAPSAEQQRARLTHRGDDPATVEERLAKAATEEAMAADLDALVVVNDDLDRAVAEVQQIIDKHR